MQITIRQEEPRDYATVFQIVEAAFKTMKYSDGDEQFLVERLRQSESFIPALSLVAEYEGQLVGHILLTRIFIVNDTERHEALTLAPVSVRPDFHKKGIGGQLIQAAHDIAKNLGYTSVVLLGHANYYPRFGYQKTSLYGIQLPFDVAEENCMIVELVKGGLDGVSGVVEYDKVFYQ